MGKIKFSIVRHGETIFNAEDKVQGWGDSFLTPSGIKTTEKLGIAWKKSRKNFTKIYSSDSGRTLETSRVILKAMQSKLAVIPTEGLREYNFGYFEGGPETLLEDELQNYLFRSGIVTSSLRMEDFSRRIDAMSALDRAHKGHNTNTWYAETAKEYKTRLLQTMEQIVKACLQSGDKEVLLVSHGMTISILMTLLVKDAVTVEELVGIANSSVTTITYQKGKYTLQKFGEILD